MNTKGTWLSSLPPQSRTWISSLPEDATPELAWHLCNDGGWLALGASASGVDPKIVVRALAAVVRNIALPHVPPNEDRPLKAIDASERWANGVASLDEVQAAKMRAYESSREMEQRAMASAPDGMRPFAAQIACAAAAKVAQQVTNAKHALSFQMDLSSVVHYAALAAGHAVGNDDGSVLKASKARAADIVRTIISWGDVSKARPKGE